MNIGVLCVQGAFAEHMAMFEQLDVSTFEIRQRSDLPDSFDGIILPGGESTVMGKLLRELGLYEPIREMIRSGLPAFGTCAGLLLLAKHMENDDRSHFALMDITARRNAYGRQLGSFRTTADIKGIGPYPMVFIRAPYITQVGPQAQELARVDGKIVAAQQDHMLVTAFHPELSQDLAVHRYFIENICKR